MLTVKLPATDVYTDATLTLEHSLVSLSKWESKHEKAFFGKEEKTAEEMSDYIAQMVLDENPPENFTNRLTQEDLKTIGDYINSKQSATWFREEPGGKANTEIVTTELIYYWMISFQIPFTCETWHLQRLMNLIRICGIKQTKPKKMSRSAQMEQYRALNAERRAKLNTAG